VRPSTSPRRQRQGLADDAWFVLSAYHQSGRPTADPDVGRPDGRSTYPPTNAVDPARSNRHVIRPAMASSAVLTAPWKPERPAARTRTRPRRLADDGAGDTDGDIRDDFMIARGAIRFDDPLPSGSRPARGGDALTSPGRSIRHRQPAGLPVLTFSASRRRELHRRHSRRTRRDDAVETSSGRLATPTDGDVDRLTSRAGRLHGLPGTGRGLYHADAEPDSDRTLRTTLRFGGVHGDAAPTDRVAFTLIELFVAVSIIACPLMPAWARGDRRVRPSVRRTSGRSSRPTPCTPKTTMAGMPRRRRHPRQRVPLARHDRPAAAVRPCPRPLTPYLTSDGRIRSCPAFARLPGFEAGNGGYAITTRSSHRAHRLGRSGTWFAATGRAHSASRPALAKRLFVDSAFVSNHELIEYSCRAAFHPTSGTRATCRSISAAQRANVGW
jgi:hypothetical protein